MCLRGAKAFQPQRSKGIRLGLRWLRLFLRQLKSLPCCWLHLQAGPTAAPVASRCCCCCCCCVSCEWHQSGRFSMHGRHLEAVQKERQESAARVQTLINRKSSSLPTLQAVCRVGGGCCQVGGWVAGWMGGRVAVCHAICHVHCHCPRLILIWLGATQRRLSSSWLLFIK